MRDTVTVAQGIVHGVDDGTVVRFQAVPFATPPVGELRWTAPRDPAAWTGIRDATNPGPRCAQPATPDGAVSSEDCLTLAVTGPSGSTTQSHHPVLVWIHGGGLSTGSGYDYDPRRLVTEGPMIVVTINYRLGALGFLGLPGLDGSGAFALLDQQAALRWVQRNISAFGGDPDNVTIAGESGGADAVCAQLTSPAAVGLFDRAILQSGSCGPINVTDAILPGAGPGVDTWKPRELLDDAGTAFAASLGCTDLGEAQACLRGVPVERLTAPGTTYWSPAFGTPTLPRRPSDAIAAGAAPTVPVLTGVNQDEGALFGAVFFGAMPLDETGVHQLLGMAAGARVAEATAAYPVTGRAPTRVWADVISDRAYACPNLRTDRAMRARAPVFVYEFADRGAPSPFVKLPPGLAGGTTHAAELPYLFDLVAPPVPAQPLTAEQQRLAAQMRGYWARFAVTGDPGGTAPDDVRWPRFGADGPLLTFTENGPAVTTAATFESAHHCALWD